MTISRNLSILAEGVSSSGVLGVTNGGTGVTTSTGSGSNVLSASPTLTGTLTVPTITSPSATALTLQSAGTTAMTIATSGNASIGATDSYGKLLVYGDAVNFSPSADNTSNGIGACVLGTNVATATSAVARLYLTGNNAAHAGTLDLRSGSVIGSTINMYNVAGTKTVYFNTDSVSYINGGNVGIGTSSPGYKLDVNGTVNVQGSILLNGSTSGTTTIKANATAGTWTLTLPTSAGTNGYVLSTDGAGNTSWLAGLTLLTTIANSLPTTLPGSSGVLWNNGGVISIS